MSCRFDWTILVKRDCLECIVCGGFVRDAQCVVGLFVLYCV
jgi:hypothetical protein